MNNPTLKAIHIGKSHQPIHMPKLAKEYDFANADRRTKKSTIAQQWLYVMRAEVLI
jgi:hypothetical protein